jgi:hypothetical protein
MYNAFKSRRTWQMRKFPQKISRKIPRKKRNEKSTNCHRKDEAFLFPLTQVSDILAATVHRIFAGGPTDLNCPLQLKCNIHCLRSAVKQMDLGTRVTRSLLKKWPKLSKNEPKWSLVGKMHILKHGRLKKYLPKFSPRKWAKMSPTCEYISLTAIKFWKYWRLKK